MAPVFGYGDMRLYLLKLLDEAPRYGYEVIRILEDRFGGAYTPSAGAIYPRLAALEDEGLVEHDEEDGRKVYRLTDEGRSELHHRGPDVDSLEAQITDWAKDLASGVLGSGVKFALKGIQHDLRDNLRDSVRDARRERRVVVREMRREGRGKSGGGKPGGPARALSLDLEAFVADVRDAATGAEISRDDLRTIQGILLDARTQVTTLLDEARAKAPSPAPDIADGPTDDEPFEATSDD